MDTTEEINKALATGDEKKDGGNAELQSQLEKAQHAAEVWAGRAKAQGDEIKNLRAEIESLKAGKTAEAAVAAIPAEVKGETPDDYLKPALIGAKQMVDEAIKELRDENKKLREDNERREDKIFAEKLQGLHRKFFDEVTPGKDKEDAWKQFKQLNKETYNALIAGHDAERFSSFVDSFYRYIGSKNPDRDMGGAAAPSPTTTGSTQHGDRHESKETMSTDDFIALRRKAEDLRRSGNMAEWRKLDAELREALNSGRVK